jgi:hypothetical protein
MSRFVGNPQALRAAGGAILEQGGQFKKLINSLYERIDELINTDYPSPEARSIATSIVNRKDVLIQMAQVIDDYGTYCNDASTTVYNNQADITDSVRS